MAGTLTTSQKAPLLVTDVNGNPVPIPAGGITVSGDVDCIQWSALNNGAIDVIGHAAGTALITVTVGLNTGTLEVTVTAPDPEQPGTLIVTLGTPVPK